MLAHNLRLLYPSCFNIGFRREVIDSFFHSGSVVSL